jgi:hypothetical protein
MNFKTLLTTTFLAASITAGAQNTNKGFAITGDGNKDFMWMNIREIDLGTGQIKGNIFERSKTNFSLTNTESKKVTDQTAITDGNVFGSELYPTSSFVAAAAFDKRSNKLFFTPMRRGELRWADMNVKNNTPSFYTMQLPGYTPSASTNEDQNITRMVIAADGYGYAITNDGSHMYRFTTGKKPAVTDLGALTDADDNKGLSVHNKCSSWGGDMIADAYGKLYIVTASKNVFVVDPSTKLTTFKGTITGLPASYTANGAAVDENGDVVLCSATMFDGYYKMNITDLKATKIEGSDVVYNASDLAGSNLLFQKQSDESKKFALTKSLPLFDNASLDNRIFPNPITSSSFNVLLDGKQDGKYNVIITDLAGRSLQSNKVSLVKGQRTEQVTLINRPAKGTYMIKVLDEKNNVIISDKVMVL